jgi:hypothetical protein
MKNKMAINVKSASTSGLVAGIVIIIVGFGLVPILGKQMNEVLASRSLPPLGIGAMIFFPLLSILFGLSIVWLYALIQPAFRSKLKAAFVSALIVWFYVYLLPNAALVAYGFMPLSLSAIGTAWGLLEVFAGGIVGYRLYKEAN